MEIDLKKEFEKIKKKYKEELSNLQTNRASIAMVEDLPVEYFGSKSPLKQVASISLADARTIVISPWNKDNLIDIEKAINGSDINLSPNNDGEVIRLNFPALTEERRKEITKILGKKTEEARIKVRKIREQAIDEVDKEEERGGISKDDKFKIKEEIQKEVDSVNNDIQEIHERKEKSIMEV